MNLMTKQFRYLWLYDKGLTVDNDQAQMFKRILYETFLNFHFYSFITYVHKNIGSLSMTILQITHLFAWKLLACFPWED